MFENKYQLSITDNQQLLMANEANLLYATGKFENLQTSPLQTKQIIENTELHGVKPNDVAVILKMKHAFDFVLHNTRKLSFADIKHLNLLIQGSEIPSAGEIRQRDVIVPLTTDVWAPPLPDEAREQH